MIEPAPVNWPAQLGPARVEPAQVNWPAAPCLFRYSRSARKWPARADRDRARWAPRWADGHDADRIGRLNPKWSAALYFCADQIVPTAITTGHHLNHDARTMGRPLLEQ